MFIAANLLPAWAIWLSAFGAFGVLAVATYYADWQALLAAPERVNSCGAALVLLLFLHLLSFDADDDLALHLLGATTATLLLGLRFALLIGALVVLVVSLFQGESLLAVPLAWVLSIAIPATVSRAMVWWLRGRSSRQPFIYIMGAGFGGGIASALATAAAGMLALSAIGQWHWVSAALGSWPVIVLIAFPEGFINGTLVTAFVVLAPDAMKLYDSADYSPDV
ncbi:MAG: energy-coupling factor ABC transporter permease [Pseudomonadota bacterium]